MNERIKPIRFLPKAGLTPPLPFQQSAHQPFLLLAFSESHLLYELKSEAYLTATLTQNNLRQRITSIEKSKLIALLAFLQEKAMLLLCDVIRRSLLNRLNIL